MLGGTAAAADRTGQDAPGPTASTIVSPDLFDTTIMITSADCCTSAADIDGLPDPPGT